MPTAESPKRKPVEVTEPFRPLPVDLLELWNHNGWILKVYGISQRHQHPANDLVAAAKRVVAEILPVACDDHGAYGVGFVSIHEAAEENLVFVNWWARETELRRRVFRSPAEAPAALVDVTADGVAGTVWDLQVFWFERNVWVEKVLSNPAGPDLEAYLKKCLTDQA